MKKFLVLLLLAGFVLTGCNKEQPKVQPTVKDSHTTLVQEFMSESVVVEEYSVRKGEFISAIIEKHIGDHKGYSSDMFLSDNPHIACRPHKPVKRCDTIAYYSRFIHPGDVLYLRLPVKIDTVSGAGTNVIWHKPDPSLESGFPCLHHSKHVLETCDEYVVLTDTVDGPVLPPNGGGDSSGDWTSWPYWPWVILGAVILLAIIIQGRLTRKRVEENHHQTRDTVRTTGGQIRGHVTDRTNHLTHHIDERHTQITTLVKEQGDADRDLLRKQMEEQSKTAASFAKEQTKLSQGLLALLEKEKNQDKK